MKLKTIFVLLFVICTNIWAAPLKYVPQTISQPNGEQINCFASGDEYYNWLHDELGYTIIQDKSNGYYYYAQAAGDSLISSKYLVGKISPITIGLTPWLKISSAKIMEKVNYMRRGVDSHKPQSIKTDGLQVNNTGTINNLVVYIRFLGETEFTDSTIVYDRMLNQATGNSMKSYFNEASYNQVIINSTMYPTSANGIVVSYQDTLTRNYYRPYSSTNTIGYTTDNQRTDREHSLLVSATNAVSTQIPSSLVIDNDNDGNVDNVCFIVAGSAEGWSDLLWPHRWSLYSQTVNINGKRVYDFNFQLRNSLMSSGVGVLCHEMFHSLGSPDLYHYSGNGISPVGPWDIMENDANPPQHMGAFMKYKYGHWISQIPAITSPGTYTLNPLTSSTNNCYKIASPFSTTEYFVVEYRKDEGTFESSLPASGLIVYRINTAAEGNADGPPDEVYIYRPGGTTTVNGTVNNANFSSTVGRTAINLATSPTPFLSTGSYGGLNIENVGAAGATISFDVSFSIPTTTLQTPLNSATYVVLTPAFQWNTISGATGYRLQVSNTSDFTSNITDAVMTTNTYTPTIGLNYGTTYYWRVKVKTGTDSSNWSATSSFSTIPVGYINLLTESFEGTTFAPTNWTTTIETGTTDWTRVTVGSHPVCYAPNGTGMARYNSYNASTDHSASLFTLPVQMKYSTENIMSFKMYRDNQYTTNADRILVYANTINSLTNATLLGTINRYIGYAPVVSSEGWYSNSFVVPEAYLSGNCNIIFKAISAYGNDIYIDDISINGTLKNILAPTLTSPVNGAVAQLLSGTLTWNQINIADQYEIEISTSSNFSTNVTYGTVYTNVYNYSQLASNTVYYWRVRGTNSYKTGEWASSSFTTYTPTAPSVVVLATPTDLSTNVAINTTLIWNTAANASNYRVQLSTANTFATTIVNEVVSTSSKTLSGLNNSSTYYWRVQSINVDLTSAWSDVRSFSTIATTPSVAVLSTPANLATNIVINPTLTWNTAANASSYRVQLSTANTFTTNIVNEVVTTTSKALSGLNNSSTYYWRVQSINADQTSAWSNVRSFSTIATIPAVAVLSSPTDLSTNLATNPTLTWNSAANASSYRVQLSIANSFTTNIVNEVVTTTSKALSGLNNSGTYYWRVQSINVNQTSAWSEVRSFSTVAATPAVVVLSSPTDLSTNIAINPTLTWSSAANASSYRVQLSSANSFTTNIVNEVVTTTSKALSGLNNSATYYWRVQSINADLTSAWSDVRSFSTIAATPAVVILSMPTNLATNIAINPTLTWNSAANAASYRVQLSVANTFATNLVNEVVTATTKSVTGLSNSTQYFWRVQAINADLTSDWSEVRNFTTVAAASSTTSQNIPLLAGWNMISSNVTPQNTAMSAITSGISAQFKIMKNATGQAYWPPFTSLLSTWNIHQAYLVNVTAPCTLTLTGTQIVPETTPITFNTTGWTWIPYYRTTAQAPLTALATISGKYKIVKSSTGQSYWPPFTSTLTNLEPNKGYLIFITAPGTLTYPANTVQNSGKMAATPTVEEPKILVTDYNNTGKSATLAIEINGAKSGDEFGVYTVDGLLVGSAVYNGATTGVNIWGDNELTAVKDGASENEELVVKLFSTNYQTYSQVAISEISNVVNGDKSAYLQYKTDGINIASAKALLNINNDTYSAISISPQPVSDEAIITFDNKSNSSVNVELFDAKGMMVGVYNFNSLNEGLNKIKIDIRNLTSGMYNVIIKSGIDVQQTKLVKVD